MRETEPVGTASALWRFPVKSMLGEELDAADLRPDGIVGNHAYAPGAGHTGKVVIAEHPAKWGEALLCRARFADAPATGFAEKPRVGRSLEVGEAVRIAVALPDPRCVMPSLAQPGLPRDTEVMKTIVRHDRLDVDGAPPLRGSTRPQARGGRSARGTPSMWCGAAGRPASTPCAGTVVRAAMSGPSRRGLGRAPRHGPGAAATLVPGVHRGATRALS